MKPTRIWGRWEEGYALDLHTLRSEYVGDDEYGHPRFDTTYSEIGGLLHRLKYRGDQSAADEIAAAAAAFVRRWAPRPDLLATVPPSRFRIPQPLHLTAAELGRLLETPFAVGALRRTREAPELKSLADIEARVRALEGVFAADPIRLRGKRVLLFDDLYRSGVSLNAATEALYGQGEAEAVFALTVTRTRSRQ